MFDHVGLNVKDYELSRAFYDKALEPLGYDVVMGGDDWKGCGYGGAQPMFWIMQREPYGTGAHVAFHCEERAEVDAFHAAALAAGGKDNGGPGIREDYSPNYYAAFVYDPDGNNIEAVCHQSE